mgnify:CR=1 FL=1
MKRCVLILAIISMGLFGSSVFLFSQTSVGPLDKLGVVSEVKPQAHYTTGQSGKFIIYFGEKETGFENYSISTSEGKVRLTDQAQFKVMEMDFVVNMDLILDTLFSPQSLDMDGKVHLQTYKVSTEFSEGKATSHMTKDGDTSTTEVPIHKDALILPNGLFYPYTFLVKR